MWSNGLFKSHSEARKQTNASQYSTVSTPRPQVWPSAAIYLTATRPLELRRLHLPSHREPYLPAHSSGALAQVFPVPGWLGQLYWLELSGNFWVIFLKKEKQPNITEKKQTHTPTKKTPTLIFCSVIWICAKLEGTTCKFFFRNGQNICLKFVVTQLSARKTWCWQHDSSIYFPLAQEQPQSHLSFHLTQFKKGVLGVRMEYNTTLTESMYLNGSEHGSWTPLLHVW